MKLFTIALISLSSLTLLKGDLTRDLKEANMKMDLPNESWFQADKQEVNGLIAYIFKRNAIEDQNGRQVIPNISVVIEDVEKGMDVITYSVWKRTQVSFEVLEVFTSDGDLLKFKNAIGYKGTYTDKNKLEHTVYIVHAISDDKGLQFICDVTTDILDKVEGEFHATLKSIRK